MRNERRIFFFLAGIIFFFTASPAFAQRHGEVTSGPCPISCRTQSIPKADCRDWQIGENCYVEDLRRPVSGSAAQNPTNDIQPNNHRPAVSRSNPMNSPEQAGLGRPTDDANPLEDRNQSIIPDFGTGVGDCEHLQKGEIPLPKILVRKVQPTGLVYTDKARVTGSIQGMCLSEAGYFEEGRKVESIAVTAQRRAQHYDFDITTAISKSAEIRVVDAAGQSDVYQVKVDRPGNTIINVIPLGYGQRLSW